MTISLASSTFASRGLRPSAHSRRSVAISSLPRSDRRSYQFHIRSSEIDITFPNMSFRGVGDPDVVVLALAHLHDAVETHEERHRQNALRFLVVLALKFAPDQEVEALVRAAQLEVGLQGDRVVALHERIEKLVHGDGETVRRGASRSRRAQEARQRVAAREAE